LSKFQRVFLGKSQPVLRATSDRLLDLAAQNSADGPLDLREYLVVLPGSRACRLLIRQLSEQSHTRNAGVLPPEIITPGQLETVLAQGKLPLVTQAEERLSWLLALQGATSAEKQQLGMDDETNGGIAGLLKMSQLYARTIRHLKQEGSNPGAAAHLIAPRDTAAAMRLRALEDLENRRLDLLRDWGVQPSGFVDALPRLPGRQVILVGISELPSNIREWLDENCRCQTWIDADSSIADRYDEWGQPIPELWESVAVPDTVPLIIADQPRDLSLAILDHISKQSSIEKVSDVTLGILDEDLVPPLSESLRRRGMGLHIATGKLHSQTSSGRLLEGIREAISSGSFAAFAALARHPDILRRLPQRQDQDGNDIDVLSDFDRWSTNRQPILAEDSDAPPALKHLLQQLLPLQSGEDQLQQRVDQFLEVMINLVGSDDDGLPDLPDGEAEIVMTTLDKLRECGFGSSVNVSAEGLSSLVCDLTSETPLPDNAEPDSIEGLGWLELAMDASSHLVLTGISEGKVSGSHLSDPLLPESLRRELKIPGYEERVARDTHLLHTLFDGHRQTVLAIAARDSQGNPLLPSRLLLRGDSGIQRLQHFLDPEKRIRLEEPINAPEGEPADLGPPVRIDTPAPAHVSVTGFARWITDPVLFQLERELGYSECHDRDRQLNPLAFGNMVHWVLEKYGKSSQYRILEESDQILAAIDELLLQYRNRKLAQHPRAAVLVQIEQARARLEIWAVEQSKLMHQGWRIMATEMRLDPQSCKLKVPDGTLGVSGRIDRIDYNETENRWRILDYKTSDQGPSPEVDHGRKAGKHQEWKNLQLPIYRHFAPTLLIDGKSIPSGCRSRFLSLAGQDFCPFCSDRPMDRRGLRGRPRIGP